VEPRTEHDAFLRERHRPAHARRGVEPFAAFVLPLLRPGMRLLDLGCGPGSITSGLADAVAPGVAIGFDLDRTADRPVRTVCGDALRLPFADRAFDAVFSCATFQHLADPVAVLAEVRRVCRPGAIVAVTDVDWDGYLLHPDDPLLRRGFEVLGSMRATGDPRVGKRLRALLAEAGFVEVAAAARATSEGGPGPAASGPFRAGGFDAPSAIARAEELGVSTAAEMTEIAAAWRRWAAAPGAFTASFWVEAVGRAPA